MVCLFQLKVKMFSPGRGQCNSQETQEDNFNLKFANFTSGVTFYQKLFYKHIFKKMNLQV